MRQEAWFAEEHGSHSRGIFRHLFTIPVSSQKKMTHYHNLASAMHLNPSGFWVIELQPKATD